MSRGRPDEVLRTARRSAAHANLLGRRALANRLVGLARRDGRRAEQRPGVTVVTVTWNSLDYLQAFLTGVRHYSATPIEILVVDNHSADGTKEFLAGQRDVRTVRTPLNIGHGLGLDLAFAHARTSEVIALDVDAFPISHTWMNSVLDPLAEGAVVAGAYVQRAFIHPSFLAMRRADYFRLNLRFVPVGVPTAPGGIPRGLFMDVGEALSQTVAVVAGSSALHRIPITSTRGDNLVGSVYGDAVYHNFYSTQGKPELVQRARQAWDRAIREYLPA